MANIELPKDAEGREIPLDTVCMYDCNGDSISITRWCFTTRLEPMFSEKNIWIAIDKEGLVKDPALLHLTPPDSWEKLEEDLDRCIEADCISYGTSLVLEDIKQRIRRLAAKED